MFRTKKRSQEHTGTAWRFFSIEMLFRDMRYAGRILSRNPGFTAVAVLSLALGIGANTAIFSVVDTLMLKTLPVQNPEQLVTFNYWVDAFGGFWADQFRYADFEQLRRRTSSFSSISASSLLDRANLEIDGSGGGIDTAQVHIGLVSGNYFSMFGVAPILGRTLTLDDDRAPGAGSVAVISYRYWQRRFALASNIVGRTFSLNGVAYTIVGVVSKGFTGDQVGQPADLWIPITMHSQVMMEGPELGRALVRIAARLKPGITMKQAQGEAELIEQQIFIERAGSKATPETLRKIKEQRFELQSDARGVAWQRREFSRPLKVLVILVGVVLLIACANIANLMLARSAARQSEMAIRLSLGAGRRQIVRQLLTESIILAVMAGALSLVFANWGTSVLARVVGSGITAVDLDLQTDHRMLIFTASISLLTGILFGLGPAFRSSHTAPLSALKGEVTGASGKFRIGKLVVVSQVGLSTVLLIGALLFVRTLQNLESQDLGFDVQHVLMIWTEPLQSGHKGPALGRLFQAVQERISSLPGVVAASVSSEGLLAGGGSFSMVKVQGYEPKSEEDMMVQWNLVAPGFFETIGMRLIAGRDFTGLDGPTTQRVAIINEAMARHYFGKPNAVGRYFGMRNDSGNEIEIVGVIKDAKYNTPRDEAQNMIYLPYTQDTTHLRGTMCVMVRTRGDLPGLMTHIREELRSIDRTLPILSANSMEEDLEKSLTLERLIAWLGGFFSGLATLLACIGLYGVMAYTVARRTSEIGVRLALGATRVKVLTMVFTESMLLGVAGIVIGVPAALASGHLITNLLFGVKPADQLSIVLAISGMLFVAALASFVPALRAARVDPIQALRYE